MNIKTSIGVVAAVAVIAIFFWFGIPGTTQVLEEASVADSSAGDNLASLRAQLSVLVEESSYTEIEPGLKIAVIAEGAGDPVSSGKMVAVHYIGKFIDGAQFDSSIDRKEPLVFEYGANQLIPGFEKGLVDMKVGGVRRIIIPPALGYGQAGVVLPDGKVVIPPNATLIFDVALIGIDGENQE